MAKRKAAKRRRLREEAAGKRRAKGHRNESRARRQPAVLLEAAQLLLRAAEVILVVGEGDFSWARALCDVLGPAGGGGQGIVATALDTAADLELKYGDGAATNMAYVREQEGRVHLGIDARALHACDDLRDLVGACRFVVFNFPHAGLGLKDEAQSVAVHRRLLRSFLNSATKMLAPLGGDGRKSEVHVTIKAGRPYSMWLDEPPLLDDAHPLTLHARTQFDPDLYPGYSHRRTRGSKDTLDARGANADVRHGAVTYRFRHRRAARAGAPGKLGPDE